MDLRRMKGRVGSTAASALLFVALAGGGLTGGAGLAAPGATPVADAARSGDLDAVRALLQEGADVNAANGDGMSALHWAAERGDAEMVDALVHAGAAVDTVTRIGHYTPLHVASTGGTPRRFCAWSRRARTFRPPPARPA